MARKKKPVVRLITKRAGSNKHAKEKRTRPASNARKASVARRVAGKSKGKTSARSKRSTKVAPRKHAPRKSGATRKHAKRTEPLLRRKKRAPAKRARKPTRKPTKEVRRGRARRGEGGGFEAPDQPTRSRESVFDEGEDFIGPIGDSYDDDFDSIDWESVDWDDVIDDIGDEEEDSYGETTTK